MNDTTIRATPANAAATFRFAVGVAVATSGAALWLADLARAYSGTA